MDVCWIVCDQIGEIAKLQSLLDPHSLFILSMILRILAV